MWLITGDLSSGRPFMIIYPQAECKGGGIPFETIFTPLGRETCGGLSYALKAPHPRYASVLFRRSLYFIIEDFSGFKICEKINKYWIPPNSGWDEPKTYLRVTFPLIANHNLKTKIGNCCFDFVLQKRPFVILFFCLFNICLPMKPSSMKLNAYNMYTFNFTNKLARKLYEKNLSMA